MQCRLITSPPENLAHYVADYIPLYERLYGAEAAATYAREAPTQLADMIRHPGIRGYAVMAGQDARALAFVRASETRWVIPFFHVSGREELADCGPELLRFLVQDLRRQDGGPIFTEYLSPSPLALDGAYQGLGFRRIDRQIMQYLGEPAPAAVPAGYVVRTAQSEEVPSLAGVLSAAYDAHPDRPLFEEVASPHAAHAFLTQCRAGAYGVCPPNFVVGAWRQKTCVALAIGAEVVRGTGFVLHMAVLPAHQSRGLGRALLDTLAGRFRNAGLPVAALGVSCDNPAARLYARAGFAVAHPCPVYYRDPV